MAANNERATKAGYSCDIRPTLASCTKFSMNKYAKLTVVVPSGSDLATLAWYGSHDGATFVAVHDPPGSALISIAQAGIGFAAPDGTAGFPWIKLKSETADTGSITLAAQS